MEKLLPLINGATLLLFGVLLSLSFSGVRLSRKNAPHIIFIYIFCAALQGIFYISISEELVWKIYPVITHLPIIIALMTLYKKHLFTAIVSTLTTYMLCQPSKLVSSSLGYFTDNKIITQAAYTLVILLTAIISLKYFVWRFTELFSHTHSGAFLFGSVPIVFYLFDYTVMVFPDIWKDNVAVATEFLPFFICIAFLVFCIVYHGESEKKLLAEKKEAIIKITSEQQAKELDAIREKEREIKILRHDLRHFLSSLSVCINDGELKKANEMIASYSSLTEPADSKHFCPFDTINYILSDFDSKCLAEGVNFLHKIELSELKVDEILLSAIISNALDNALNAQKKLPKEKRLIQLVLKNSDGKLLISVKNPYAEEPIFSDGIPITSNEGHGTGVQSICYMTERLNGNYQFSARDNMFTVRIII